MLYPAELRGPVQAGYRDGGWWSSSGRLVQRVFKLCNARENLELNVDRTLRRLLGVAQRDGSDLTCRTLELDLVLAGVLVRLDLKHVSDVSHCADRGNLVGSDVLDAFLHRGADAD